LFTKSGVKLNFILKPPN